MNRTGIVALDGTGPIDPRHECPGVLIPEVRLEGARILTAGVGLPVLLGAAEAGVREDAGEGELVELVWYSAVIGDHEDETRVIVARDAAVPAERSPTACAVVAKHLPRPEFAPAPREYELTVDVAAHFGLSLEDPRPTRAPAPIRVVTSHDEHWSTMAPVGARDLRRVLEGVLRQLDFLRGRDTAWRGELDVADELIDDLAGLVRSHPSLRLDGRSRHLPASAFAAVEAEVPAVVQTWWERTVAHIWFPPRRLLGYVARQTGRREMALVPARRR